MARWIAIWIKAALEFYKLYEKALVDCDKTIEQALIKSLPQPQEEKELKATNNKNRKHAAAFLMFQKLHFNILVQIYSLYGELATLQFFAC